MIVSFGSLRAIAATSSATRLTSSEDWVETRNSRGFARCSTFAHHDASGTYSAMTAATASPARPSPVRRALPHPLHADAREQDQRQQRVQHEPGELLARPRVDRQRERERPHEEGPQHRRLPEREHRPDGGEQEHGPLVREQHDDVEVGLLAAAPDVVLAEPVVRGSRRGRPRAPAGW